MMNIEDWLASATDELMEARTGHTISRDINTWRDLPTRLEYLTTILSAVTPEGATALIDELEQALEDVQEATDDANEAAGLIDNMTVAAATLSAGSPASIVRWEKVENRYELELGIPVPTFTTSTTTTYDGTTAANVTVNNSNSLTRNLAFSIPVAKFTVNQTSAVTSGNISGSASVSVIDNNTLNPKFNFGIPVVTPQKGTVTTRNTGNVDSANLFTLTDTSTLTPKLNFEIPVQQIKAVQYVQATPGTAGNFEIIDSTKLDPTLKLTVPVQNLSQIAMSVVDAGLNPTATVEYLDTSKLNLKLNLTVPAIPKFQQNVVVTNNESATSRATATITGTADNLVLNLNFPPDISSTVATATRLGSIKIGDSLTIDNSGIVNTIRNEYELNITRNDWVLDNNIYTYTISNISNVTSDMRCKAYLDNSYFNLISNLEIETTDQNEIIFRTSILPAGTIEGYFVLERTNQED